MDSFASSFNTPSRISKLDSGIYVDGYMVDLNTQYEEGCYPLFTEHWDILKEGGELPKLLSPDILISYNRIYSIISRVNYSLNQIRLAHNAGLSNDVNYYSDALYLLFHGLCVAVGNKELIKERIQELDRQKLMLELYQKDRKKFSSKKNQSS